MSINESNPIGSRIKERRISLGLSQQELAELIGYADKSSINKIESNARNLTQSKIKPIADALKTTPNYLMGWSDDPEKGLSQNNVVINLYDQLDNLDKGRIIGTMEEMLRNDKYKDIRENE